VASAFGGRSTSLRSRTVVEIEDATKIPAKYLRRLCARSYVTEALQRAVREDVAAYSQGTEDGGLVSTVPGIAIRKEKVAA
jgi:Arc/MetJ family transcription regulator